MRFDITGLPPEQQARAVRYELIGVCAQIAGLAWSDRALLKADPAALPRANRQEDLDALVDQAARDLVSLLDGGQDPVVTAFREAGKLLADAASNLARQSGWAKITDHPVYAQVHGEQHRHRQAGPSVIEHQHADGDKYHGHDEAGFQVPSSGPDVKGPATGG